VSRIPTDRKTMAYRDSKCYEKARERGQITFTLVEQDVTSTETICEWIKLNIWKAPPDKLAEALDAALEMVNSPLAKKTAD
jgi:hypothetical protein